jgi:hypothetical protein
MPVNPPSTYGGCATSFSCHCQRTRLAGECGNLPVFMSLGIASVVSLFRNDFTTQNHEKRDGWGGIKKGNKKVDIDNSFEAACDVNLFSSWPCIRQNHTEVSE